MSTEDRINQITRRLLLGLSDPLEVHIIQKRHPRNHEPVKPMPIRPGGLLQHILFWEPELAQLLGIKAEQQTEPVFTEINENNPF